MNFDINPFGNREKKISSSKLMLLENDEELLENEHFENES